MTRAYIGTGTNLGQRLKNLDRASELLMEIEGVELLRKSHVYETEPWGYTEQPSFLNQALEIDSTISPLALLHRLKAIEAEMGRQPTFHLGPRLIDMDILLYNELVLQSDELTVPHPHMHERAFVLVPLAELAPEAYHPLLHRTASELLQDVDTSGIKKLNTTTRWSE
jgi:2-amino-4-hydroxy-6-hydroxymethyldihydropteridine diphosphokinase